MILAKRERQEHATDRGGEGEDASLKQGGREQNDRVDVAALARLLSTVGPRATSTAGRSTRGIVGHSERLETPRTRLTVRRSANRTAC